MLNNILGFIENKNKNNAYKFDLTKKGIQIHRAKVTLVKEIIKKNI